MRDDYFDAVVNVDASELCTRVKLSEILTEDSFADFSKQCRPAASNSTCSICLTEIEKVRWHDTAVALVLWRSRILLNRTCFTKGEKVSTIFCKHEYHPACLWQWITSRCESGACAKCPVCNRVLFAPVVDVEYFHQVRAARAIGESSCCVLMWVWLYFHPPPLFFNLSMQARPLERLDIKRPIFLGRQGSWQKMYISIWHCFHKCRPPGRFPDSILWYLFFIVSKFHGASTQG